MRVWAQPGEDGWEPWITIVVQVRNGCRIEVRRYHLRRKTGTIEAIIAAACKASTQSACLGALGSHLIAKKSSTGICPTVSSCHVCAAAPSSAWRAIPATAICVNTTTNAASDIPIGTTAPGFFTIKPNDGVNCFSSHGWDGTKRSLRAERSTLTRVRSVQGSAMRSASNSSPYRCLQDRGYRRVAKWAIRSFTRPPVV